MKKYQYKCTLLTDAVITSLPATEGYRESLDYIPGAKFLGIAAAKLYDVDKGEKTQAIFHSGNVKFGDAMPFYDNEEFLKVPLAWYYEKGTSLSEGVVLHHQPDHKNKSQLKQARGGYFSRESKKLLTASQHFSLKSAYSSESRKSEDGKMFGYFSLQAGTEFVFTVEDSTGIYADEIKTSLVGRKRIGRSRSAEYGLVDITFISEIQREDNRTITGDVIIYAKSNLAFLNNETGVYTAQPTAEQLVGIPGAEILWDKCQLRTRTYVTWNRKRSNRDSERLIIQSGSVFVVRVSAPVNAQFFSEGLGIHQNEGFGQVMVNPEFLMFTGEYKLAKESTVSKEHYAVSHGENDEMLLNSLLKIKAAKTQDFDIDERVNRFVREEGRIFQGGVSKSQWGSLRNYGKNLNSYAQFKEFVFNKTGGFLYKGVTENVWKQKGRRVVLEEFLDELPAGMQLPFIVKLSNQMAKK